MFDNGLAGLIQSSHCLLSILSLFQIPGVLELMSNTLTETDLVSLKKQFVELDANGDGRVTVSELAAAIERDSEFGGV